MYSGDGLRACQCGSGHGVVRQQVDLSGQSVCGLEDGLVCTGVEERRLGAGEPEEVLEVRGQAQITLSTTPEYDQKAV